MELTFSFRKPKEVKAEKYPNTPVLTYLGGDKTAKFELNKEAVRLLGFENSITARISFGLASAEQMFLANTTGHKTGNQNNLTLTNSFSTAKLLERMQKFFNITIVEGDEFVLATSSEKTDFPVLLLTVDNPNSRTTEDFAKFEDDSHTIYEVEEIVEAGEVEIF